MRRAALLFLVAALCAVLPASAPAARAGKACGKRHACAVKACAQRKRACHGRAGLARRGLPVRWTRYAALPAPAPKPGTRDPGRAPTTPGGDPSPPPPPPLPEDDPRFVQVTARDSDPDALRLNLSRTTVLAGSVGVEFNNKYAEDPHDLQIRMGGTTHPFDTVAAGAAATRQVALAEGTWKLWCAIGNHEERGMVAHLTVIAG